MDNLTQSNHPAANKPLINGGEQVNSFAESGSGLSEQTVEYHLQEALSHLKTALNKSVSRVIKNENEKKQIGGLWEQFLGEFFGFVRDKGKQSKLNLLAWITFPRIRP